MIILVSDTSILIDLERGGLLEAAFSCGLTMVVPDLLYERELEPGELLGSLVGKLTLPVRWDLVQTRLTAVGDTTAVELPPAGVLAGMARTDLPGTTVRRMREAADAVGFGGGHP